MKNKIRNIGEQLTPKESNVYSKWAFCSRYDSEGVEQENEHRVFYKHTILSGLELLINMIIVLFFLQR